MVLVAETFCILAGMTPLIIGYYQSNLSMVAIGCAGIGLLWLLSQWRRWTWVATLGLLMYISTAGLGVWIGMSPILMGLSVLGSLLAWDLADFSRRLRSAVPEDDLRSLEKNHLMRLASLGAVGYFLILVALFIHLQISFGWIFLLVSVAVLGLLELAKRLQRGG